MSHSRSPIASRGVVVGTWPTYHYAIIHCIDYGRTFVKPTQWHDGLVLGKWVTVDLTKKDEICQKEWQRWWTSCDWMAATSPCVIAPLLPTWLVPNKQGVEFVKVQGAVLVGAKGGEQGGIGFNPLLGRVHIDPAICSTLSPCSVIDSEIWSIGARSHNGDCNWSLKKIIRTSVDACDRQFATVRNTIGFFQYFLNGIGYFLAEDNTMIAAGVCDFTHVVDEPTVRDAAGIEFYVGPALHNARHNATRCFYARVLTHDEVLSMDVVKPSMNETMSPDHSMVSSRASCSATCVGRQLLARVLHDAGTRDVIALHDVALLQEITAVFNATAES